MVTSMSCRRFPILAISLAVLAIAPATAGALTITPRIVGGSTVSTSTYPWQALVTMEQGSDSYLCGGVILSATRIATAAHCVVGFSNFGVYTGVDSRASAGTPANVASADAMPTYDADADTNDVAILTLATPLTLAANSKSQAIPLVPSGAAPVPGRALDVSGYGTTSYQGITSPTLQATTVNEVADSTCVSDYASTGSKITRPDLVVCAAAPGKDSCQGDSGGPLVQMTPTPVLIGIVNSGIGCADSRFPGIYAEVADPAINTFLSGRSAPTPTSAVRLSSTSPQVGQEIACSPGTWTGSPAFAYLFLSDDGILQGPSADPTYTLQPGDVGSTVSCEVVASANGAAATASSGRTGPVAAAAAAALAPAPAPAVAAPAAAPAPAPAPLAKPAALVDRTAPTVKVLSADCVGRRCSLRLRVSDRGFSAGIRSLKVTLTTTYATTCKRRGHRSRPCTRAVRHTLKARRAGRGTTWSVVAPRVRYGRQRFSIVALDRAGNRQRHATTRTLTAKAKASHKRSEPSSKRH
jgi:hypothetical protein